MTFSLYQLQINCPLYFNKLASACNVINGWFRTRALLCVWSRLRAQLMTSLCQDCWAPGVFTVRLYCMKSEHDKDD